MSSTQCLACSGAPLMTFKAEWELFATAGERSASTRIRAIDWFRQLGLCYRDRTLSSGSSIRKPESVRHTAEAAYRSALLMRRSRVSTASSTFVQREAIPFGNGDVERRILSRSPRSVYDLDDGNHVHPGKVNRVWASLDAARFVIVGSEQLEDYVKDRRPDVVRIPTCVPARSDAPLRRHEISDVRTVLWIGSFSTFTEIQAIEHSLARAYDAEPFRLLIVGDRRTKINQSIAHFTELVEWSPTSEKRALSQATLGIMPLRDLPFNRFKCAYKLLQYGSEAIASLGSPVGENRQLLTEANSCQPSSPEEWEEAIVTHLRTDEEKLLRLGRDLHRVVYSRYSFDAWKDDMCLILDSPP